MRRWTSLGSLLLALCLTTMAVPVTAESGDGLPCTSYDGDEAPDTLTYASAYETVPPLGPVGTEPGARTGIGNATGEAWGFEDLGGHVTISAAGSGPVSWKVLAAEGPQAGQVLAEGSLSGPVAPTVLFDEEVSVDRVCFVVTPVDETSERAHVFVVEQAFQLPAVDLPAPEEVLEPILDPLERCAMVGIHGGSPVGLDEQVTACTPADPW